MSSAVNGSGPAAGADRAGPAGGPEMGTASLAVDELVAGYGEVIALDGVTVTAGAGGITAVLGANGAGKTTLLRAVSGMIKPRRGRILLADHDVAGRSPEQIVRAGIAHVPEGQGVIPELTVEENLRIGMMSWRRGQRAARVAALEEEYARFKPLADRRRKLASTLSGGERQMLVIARALLARPRVLLLDEPSLGLAPRVMAQVMDLVVPAQPGARAHHRAGRAERARGARHRRPRRRAQPRPGGRLGRCRDARRRRRATPPLPRVLGTRREHASGRVPPVHAQRDRPSGWSTPR